MNNDLSTEAFSQWWNTTVKRKAHAWDVWQECRRRSKLRERQAFEFGLDSNLYSDKMMSRAEVEQAWIAYQKANHGT